MSLQGYPEVYLRMLLNISNTGRRQSAGLSPRVSYKYIQGVPLVVYGPIIPYQSLAQLRLAADGASQAPAGAHVVGAFLTGSL